MFEKFGEMNSAEELNELAENLFNEGDFDNLRQMAKENGIPSEYVETYINGDSPALCDPLAAALGKLEIEKKGLEIKGLIADWVSYIEAQCLENDDMAIMVRRKEKALKMCLGKLLEYSFKNRMKVDQEIVKAAKITGARVEFGIPGMKDAKRIIREYYLEDRA